MNFRMFASLAACSLMTGPLFAVLTLEQAVHISQETGRPILAVAGSNT